MQKNWVGGTLHAPLAAAVFMLSGAPYAAADPILDQYFDPTGRERLFAVVGVDRNDKAQTFTVGVTGTLTRVDVFMYNASAQADLLLEVRATRGGIPLEDDVPVLAAVRTLASSIPRTVQFVSFDIGSFGVFVSDKEDRKSTRLNSSHRTISY